MHALFSHWRRLVLTSACGCLAAAPLHADFLSENFDTWANGSTNKNGWVINQGFATSAFTERSAPNAAQLGNSTTSSQFLRTPLLTNGVGVLTFWAANRLAASLEFYVESSPDRIAWTTLATRTNDSTDTYSEHNVALHLYSPAYIRIRKQAAASTTFLGIDDVELDDPPARVVLANRATIPDVPLHNNPVHITVQATAQAFASNVVLTAHYRIGTVGAFTPIAMVTNNSPTAYITQTPIPGQDVGTKVQYYVEATFAGYNATSPAYNPAGAPGTPAEYTVNERAFETDLEAVAVVDGAATNLNLVNDYTWQGVVDAGASSGFSFRFLTLSTNGVTTNLVGDADQVHTNFVVRGAGASGEPPIVVGGTFSGLVAFAFNETNGAYDVRQAVYADFDTWPDQPTFTDSAHAGWTASSASIVNPDAARKVRGKAIYLEAGAGAVRSAELPDGIGNIQFWYRSWEPTGAPATAFKVQKSKTGGVTPGEWTDIETVSSITATNFLQYTRPYNDRHYRYVRVLCSGGARLVLDEVLVHYAAAGVRVSNLEHLPTNPSATNPVSVRATVEPRTGASNVVVTLFHTDTADAFQSIAMTNRGDNVYAPVAPIPAGMGIGPGGTGRVRYYIETTFAGFEAALASPTYLPEGGATSPAAYTNRRATVALSNPQVLPTPPVTGLPIHFGIDVAPDAGASNVNATLFYRLGGTGGYTGLSMTGGAHVATVSAIPALTVPGTRVEYYYSVDFAGPDAQPPTHFPPQGAATPLWFAVRQTNATAYAGMDLRGSFHTNMLLVADRAWQRVLHTNAIGATAFRFESGATAWGDSNPASGNFPVHGTAEVSAPDIGIAEAHNGFFKFDFNEQTRDYDVQKAAYQNFDAWTAATNGTWTQDGWRIADGRTTGGAPGDLARVIGASGKSLVLSATTNAAVRSPHLPNGIGEIHLLYRNWETNGQLPAALSIEKSILGTNWLPVAGVTNILAVDGLHAMVRITDRNFHYVRIRNHGTPDPRALVLDEVVVTEPGASVVFSNLVHAPVAPTVTNQVEVSVDIYALSGASNLTATLWFRAGSSGLFDPLPLVPIGNTYRATIPRGPPGLMQYYVECLYEGFGAAPAYFPIFGSAGPAVYTNSNIHALAENFDSWAQNQNTNNVALNGWLFRGTLIGAFFNPRLSLPNALWMGFHAPSYAQMPYFPDGIGALSFWTRPANVSAMDFEIQTSADGLNWAVHTQLTATDGALWKHTLIPMMIREPVYVRFVVNQAGSYLGVDNVTAFFPPAEVGFRLNMTHPGYPSSSDVVRVSCYVTNVYAQFPAFNIDAAISYRTRPRLGTTWSGWSAPIPTTRATTPAGRYLSGTIPRQPTFHDVQYRVEATFNGYSGTNAMNHSVSYFPVGTIAVNTQYFAPPAEGFQYTVRRFQSGFSTNVVHVNGMPVAMTLLRDRTWQGVANLTTPSASLHFEFAGEGGYTNNADRYLDFSLNAGDDDAWKTSLPLASRGGRDELPVSIGGGPYLGQVLFRYNEQTHDYSVQRALAQNFETFQPSGNTYVRTFDDGQTPLTVNFDAWEIGTNRSDSVTFSELGWSTTNAPGGDFAASLWGIYNSRVDYAPPSRLVTATNQGTFPRYLVRPRFDGETNPKEGVGTVSLRYRREVAAPTNAPAPPITIQVWTCPSNLPYEATAFWIGPHATMQITDHNNNWRPSVNTFSNITINTGFTRDIIIFQSPADTVSMALDEARFTEWRATTMTNEGWIASEAWITSTMAFGGAGRVLEFDVTRENSEDVSRQWLRGPRMTNGVGWISLRYSRADTLNPVSFKLQWAPGADPNNWQEFTNVVTTTAYNGPAGQYTLANFGINTTNDVYVRVLHTSGGGKGRLLLDDVQFGHVVSGSTWAGDNLRVSDTDSDATRLFRGQTGFLNNSLTADIGTPPPLEPKPILQSPALSTPLGEISFWYRKFGLTANPARVNIQASSDLLNWVTLDTLDAANTEFLYYATQLVDTAHSFVRIQSEIAGFDRIVLDDVIVAEPLAADLRTRNLVLDPEDPLDRSTVHAYVTVFDPFLDPVNIQPTLHFFTGTNLWNVWSDGQGGSRPMLLVASNPPLREYTYRTASPLPTNAIDTVVQYYVKTTFGGALAHANSPRIEKTFTNPAWYYPVNLNTQFGFPSNGIPYYIVFSCPRDAVWINEVDAVQLFGSHANDYVELAGWAGANLRNWTIDIHNPAGTLLRSYTITNNPVLLNEQDSHGFWVLAKDTVSARDQTIPGADDMEYPGGIRLRRTFGIHQSAVCFGGSVSALATLIADNFTYIGSDGTLAPTPLSAQGTGNRFTNFTWTASSSASIGARNPNQTLTTPPFNNPVLLIVTAHGNATPHVGSAPYTAGTMLAVAIQNSPVTVPTNALYTALGWTGTGDAPASGNGTNTGAFALNVDSEVRWRWSTNYWLDVSISGSGSVLPSSAFYAAGTNLLLNPSPSAGFAFGGWSGPGVPPGGSTNVPLNLTMNQARHVTAAFVPEAVLGSGDVAITGIRVDSNVWMTVTGTNNWVPRPWINTNLLHPGSWVAVTNFNYTYSNGLYNIWFPLPPHARQFYDVSATDDP